MSLSIFISHVTCQNDACLASKLASQELQEKGRDFIFIRHGQTPWGPDDILKGPQDLNLNGTGRHQAEQAFFVVKEHKVITTTPIIYSSHLQRAYETATIFADKLAEETTIHQLEGLQERYYGDYSKAPSHNPRAYKPSDAESIEDFQKRVHNTFISIFEQSPQKSGALIVVSHQKVFEFLTEWLSHKKLRLDQGGVCYFKFKDGVFSPQIYESSSSCDSDE